MRLTYGALLPLIIQLVLGVGLLFGDLVKTPGGSFVPLMVMLLSAPLAFITLMLNVASVYDRKAARGIGSLFFRGMLLALSVPLLMFILLLVGPVFLN
ncbi:MAG: hypothetical protein SF172_16850 [Burkholderiales bacterium]|nr:hypothetical protein [Burkholderiales bacterium]